MPVNTIILEYLQGRFCHGVVVVSQIHRVYVIYIKPQSSVRQGERADLKWSEAPACVQFEAGKG